jgi:hypothetical protein
MKQCRFIVDYSCEVRQNKTGGSSTCLPAEEAGFAAFDFAF